MTSEQGIHEIPGVVARGTEHVRQDDSAAAATQDADNASLQYDAFGYQQPVVEKPRLVGADYCRYCDTIIDWRRNEGVIFADRSSSCWPCYYKAHP